MHVRQRCAIAVMAKAPQAGRAKTRLCPPLSLDQAAALSAAFLRDITENIVRAAESAPIDPWIAYAPAGGEAWFDGHVATGSRLVLADGTPPMPHDVQGFGRCLLHAVQALLHEGYGAVCLVNADGPTLPTAFLVQAARALMDQGERVVLGPADDGGYYLIGMTSPHAHLFADITWSTGNVAAATVARAASLGMPLLTLPVWYDVDDAASLERLQDELAGAGLQDGHVPYAAPATRAFLSAAGLTLPVVASAYPE